MAGNGVNPHTYEVIATRCRQGGVDRVAVIPGEPTFLRRLPFKPFTRLPAVVHAYLLSSSPSGTTRIRCALNRAASLHCINRVLRFSCYMNNASCKETGEICCIIYL